MKISFSKLACYSSFFTLGVASLLPLFPESALAKSDRINQIETSDRTNYIADLIFRPFSSDPIEIRETPSRRVVRRRVVDRPLCVDGRSGRYFYCNSRGERVYINRRAELTYYDRDNRPHYTTSNGQRFYVDRRGYRHYY